MSNSFRPRSSFSNMDRYSASLPVIKMRLENEIIRKREAENRRTETARSNDRYFQNCNLQTEKFDDWTSPRSAQLSHRQSKLRDTEIDVENRRIKLKKLYQAEKLKEEEAMKAIQEEEEKQKWENMKDKVQHFRHSKSAKLSEFLEKKEHEKWKSTNDSFRVFESELKRQQQKEMWTIQLQQREEEKARLMEEKKREAAQMERLVQEEKRRDELERQMELEKKQQWKKDLDAQVEQLRVMDFEANEKRREQERLIAEAASLEAIKEEMKKKEDERARKKQNGEFLTKQHLAKLRQRSKEVTADLEREMNFVEKLAESDRSEKKEKTRQDIMRFLELLENHRQIEKERLQQSEFLFQEEAKKLWEKRESEWEAERLARKKLMEDVITIQKKQIDERLFVARQERERLLLDREELIRSLESYHNQMKMKEMDTKNKQIQMKEDLLAQVDQKQRREEEFIRLEEQKRKHQEIMEAAHNQKHWNIAMDKLKL
ncbi:trichoplein keratin filament-binding protein-like [Daphnia carinata]|uniref:trichoplein keratin filament-binding protein-like n=1 Tax=Daphnia carinata TaxID=120202 RepID=UPI00257EB727|nr:trichoplein keratin filament-binding protein-like [Daphnia carinata]